MSEKIPENLDVVSKTLLMTLYARAAESQRPNPLIKDDTAVAIVKRIDCDFSHFRMHEHDEVAVVLRMKQFDRIVREFLNRNPEGRVVHIGCGLDTRFDRVDNQRVEWYDLDLSEVIEMRKRFIGGEHERYHLLSCSVLSDAWLGEVSSKGQCPTLFVAEGVLVYFEEARVKELVLNLQAHFPGAELVIDGQRPFMIWANSLQLAVGGMSARLHWGLKHGKDLENWGEGISMLEEWFFFDKPEPRLRAIQWMRYLPGIAKSTGIFHYRLGAYAR